MQKKHSSSKKHIYYPTVLLSVLMGTYLDLLLTGLGLYEFPIRPFPDVFSIQLFFVLGGLPVLTWGFLRISAMLTGKGRMLFILVLGLAGGAFEAAAERMGFFVHAESWNHAYSAGGYLLFYCIIWSFFIWTNQ